ncbi:MAG: Bax inhibitor-1/YccA family protein [Flavobacteriales bacterium]|nr:Bax inhibitor-1/YccA family protein [Flavobacteriales bacterium]
MDQFLNKSQDTILDYTSETSSLRKFFANVYTYMGIGLAISGVVAYVFGHTEPLLRLLATETGLTPLGYIVMFSPLVFTLFFARAIQRLSTPLLAVVFIAFAVVMGMSMSFIFLAYTSTSIVQVFAITAVTFGVFALLGYTTKTDLTKLGMILGIGFIVLIVVQLLSYFFFPSGQANYILACVGVFLTVGLIAYHIQQLKRIGSGVEHGSMEATKLALIGAFTLYISFINLFMFLLRIFGKRE